MATRAELFRRAEWAVAIMATLVLVGLHLVFLFSAGGLWRDEVDCLNFASLSSPGEAWANLQFQSFPLLWTAALRAWMSVVPEADIWIRTLGLLMGLGVIVVLWRNARVLGHSIPLIALTLLGFNAAVIVYGDSIRGYGLGMLTGLLAFGLVWQAADTPTPVRMAAALLSSLMAVHCLYYNAIFVLAACAGGVAVSLERRAWRAAGLISGVCAVSMASLAVYTSAVVRARAWNGILRVHLDRALLWSKVKEACASTGGTVHWIWIASAAFAVGAAFWARSARGLSKREREASLYCGVAIPTGVLFYVLFLRALSYVTEPWYYVDLMALVAACLDSPLSILARMPIARGARLAAAVVMMALVSRPLWTATSMRRTNVDLIAAKTAALAAEGDLVVVCPWNVGITFDRYYRGRADWVTLPPIASHATHRYDLFMEAMKTPAVMSPVLDRMKSALRGGHRVFWVGDFLIQEGRESPSELPPASWLRQVGDLIKSHAKAGARMEIPSDAAVNPYEDEPLYVFSGW